MILWLWAQASADYLLRIFTARGAKPLVSLFSTTMMISAAMLSAMSSGLAAVWRS